MKSIHTFLRSLFIAIFPVYGLACLFYNVVKYVQDRFSWEILGLFLTAITIVIFFAGLFIKPRARTSRGLNTYSLFITLGLILSTISIILNKQVAINIIVPNFILVIGWILYIKWYSSFKNRTHEHLKVGNRLPDFELENSDFQKVASNSFLGKPSIFLFYRGNWCPLCMAQIKEIAQQYQELEKLGVHTILVSPQPHKNTASLAKKFKVNFHFLVDAKNKVAKQLGILAENGLPAGFQVLGYDSDTVMPTVIITDKNGKIIFADLTDNYRVRPEPEEFLKVIRNANAA